MVYPHVIDTSQVLKKPSWPLARLKHLVRGLLEERIQVNERGHDPVEDAVSSMKLAQLKIQNGPNFYYRTSHGITMDDVLHSSVFNLASSS